MSKEPTLEEVMDMISNEVIPDIDETPYEVLFAPSKDGHADVFSCGLAIDIGYTCPKCETERAVTWVFSDSDMFYPDECCGQLVLFKARKDKNV
jgi:hypothetical protein